MRVLVPVAIGLAVAAVMGCAGHLLAREYSSDMAYRRACEAAGHHIVDRNGHWLCVSGDGRVMEP